MSLFDYYAIQKALELSKDPHSGWKINSDSIHEIEGFFRPFLNDQKFALIPRFNGSYISFRYCGLEVLRYTKKAKYKIKICETNGHIRSVKKEHTLKGLKDIEALLLKIRDFLRGYRENFKKVAREGKQQRYVCGFSLEHWLESIILADTTIGKNARRHLGINEDLKMVVSQAPVILDPLPGSKRKRHHHIDLMSIDRDGKVAVVELKKDDDYAKALKELDEYTNWLLKKGTEFDHKRGNPEAMAEEHYFPKADFNLSTEDIKAIAVLIDPPQARESKLKNGVALQVVELPKNWLSGGGDIFSNL